MSLLTALGAALFHFNYVPEETHVGVECIAYIFIGMTYADIVVNFDLIMSVVQLRYCAGQGTVPFAYVYALYPALGIIGLIILAIITNCCLCKWTNPSVALSYLIYGFCVSLPFIPRLDEKHPGFLGHRSSASSIHAWPQGCSSTGVGHSSQF